ncbi:hypothetical protein [Tabrizicola sp.]|uniref:hypothetical protein n=1 Tax=Tabrizicola sp. TaxID=2005166 RepID=UPI003F371B16
MKAIVTLGLLALGPVAAHAEGCAPDEGIAVPEIEAMNQLLLNKDFDGFSAAVEEVIGIKITGDMKPVAEIFVEGFDGCATIVQRVDVGGMVQHVVVFNGKPGPLYGYWMAIPRDDGVRIMSFIVHTDLDKVMMLLR